MWNDVQAIVRSGMRYQQASAMVLLEVTDAQHAKKWIGDLVAMGQVPAADQASSALPKDTAFVQLAFTRLGLETLGVSQDELEQFADPFLEGMSPDPMTGDQDSRRAGMLGDVGHNDQKEWVWGGAGSTIPRDKIHILALIYGPCADVVAGFLTEQLGDFGVQLADGIADPADSKAVLETYLKFEDEERFPRGHFGFADGISQPIIKDENGDRNRDQNVEDAPNPEDTKKFHEVTKGEFILGYPNESGDISPHPDFGRNGSFVVVRQLQQHVEAFEAQAESLAKELFHRDDELANPTPCEIEEAAAKIIGRKKDGTPLLPKEFGNPATLNPYENNFGYLDADKAGLYCPLGSHVRRSNPRDTGAADKKRNLHISKRHRMVRRGRLYGDKAGKNTEKGLAFVCINGDIARQFEFVQQTWINNPTFAGLHSETDPLLSFNELERSKKFTVQKRPVPAVLKRSGPLTTLRGGGYFFLPSLSALKKLAEFMPSKCR